MQSASDGRSCAVLLHERLKIHAAEVQGQSFLEITGNILNVEKECLGLFHKVVMREKEIPGPRPL